MDIEKKKIKGGCKIVQVHDMERILLRYTGAFTQITKLFAKLLRGDASATPSDLLETAAVTHR
jgi:hypothetical protein